MLPGESQDEYSQGLAELQTELQASTLFETYLVQKMFDCVWWVRRVRSDARLCHHGWDL